MLLQLNIQNFAIVRDLDIDWQSGMTTITGETGAGKSIAIDALGLCLGERATTHVVRPHCKKAELIATFDISKNKAATQWLKKSDLHLDNECILRRIVSAEGRSKAYINGSQVPLAQLKDIGQYLLNIHGQHDHQLIIKSSEQRKIVDAFAEHSNLLDEVKYHYQQHKLLNTELSQLQQTKHEQDAKRQLLQYQVEELDEFSLQPGEFLSLESDYKRHSNAQDILNETLRTLHILSGDEQTNIVDSLRKSSDNMQSLSQVDSALANIAQTLAESLIQIEDASIELRHYHDSLELDPQLYETIESRYSQAIQLAKKHQVTPDELVNLHQELKKQLAMFSSNETRLLTIVDDISHVEQSYINAADILTVSRIKAAKRLSHKLTNSMQALNMPHGQFSIKVHTPEQKTISVYGNNDIQFMVSINPGQPFEAMHKVASGGELSRISLAMQVLLADKVVSPTLIFDEVDVGISGPTAAMVGEKLQALANNTQVICVTHLPQVASKGHQQLFVAKLTDGEHTETKVTELCPQDRVKEIARLLAGNKITDSSLANAEELLAS